MATRHTGGDAQEDSDTDLSERDDRTEKGSENKGKRDTKQKILRSKVMQRVTGRKRGADVAPAVKKVQSPPAHVQAPTARRTSDTVVQQLPKHSQDNQQIVFQHLHPPPPGGQHRSDPHTPSPGTTQQRSDTPPQQTHATAGSVICGQPRHPSYSDSPQPPQQSMGYDHLQQHATVVPDPHHQEEDHRHGDPTSNDQQLRRLELENKRLKREKDMIEKTMLDYEAQLASKEQEIGRMRKVRTGPLPHVVPPVTVDEAKLEMSLVARNTEITQLTADKNLLEHELQKLQTKYKCLVTEKDAALHQVETVTHQLKTAQEIMEEKNRTHTEKLQRMEREKDGSLQEQLQKDRIWQLEDELRGMAAEKRASEEALRKQAQNNQELYERLLHDAHEKMKLSQTKEDEDKQLRQELHDVQSQLEDSTIKVTALEQTKQLLQIQYDEDKKNWERELRTKLQEEKAQSHTTQQQLRQELETLQREQQQKLLAAKKEASEQFVGKYREKKMKYKNKIAALEQEVHAKQQLTENMDIRKYEIRLAEQQQQLVTMQQQLTAARESANRFSRRVTELTEEKRRLVNTYETKLVEEKESMEEYVAQLEQQKESQQQTEEHSRTDERKLADITEQLKHEKTVVTTLHQRLMESQLEVARLSQELEQKRNHVSELRQQVTTLQQLLRQNNGSTTTIDSVEGLNKAKERGRGCYGAVYEVRVNGFPCIAKRLHDILVGRKGMEPVGDEQRTAVISCFRREGDILSCLRHPNIVQMLGVHCGSDEADISLIMEYMHMDLEHCMKTYPDIPLPYKTSILRDVAYGLAYLHSKAIIHRDLNAGNVLLTESLRAKIADLGMSKLFDRKVVMQRTKTVCPGALDFMPPESLTKAPKYSDKLDIFSFGHLTIFLVNQEEPHVDDNSLAPGDVAKKQVQFGKRREALVQMSHQLGGSYHLLYSTVVQCLSDTPDQRPTSRDLVKRMEEICQQHPIPHKNTLETLAIVATQQEETLKEMKQYNTQLKSSNQVLQSRLVGTKKESSELQQRCGTLQQELELVRRQYKELEEENTSSNQVLRTYCTDMQAMLRQMETQLGPKKNTTHEAFQ